MTDPTPTTWRIARGLLAPVVPLAFGAPGYRVAARGFTPLAEDALQGRTVLITGANGGLGLAASRAMAALGAQVVMACRDPARGQAALHGLVHNAAVLPATLQRTPSGEELTLATNLLGPFRLTRALLAALEAAPRARVVMVSSGGMFTQRLQLELLDPDPTRPFDGAVAYARTKRALVTLGELWEARLEGRVRFHAMHPGWADTPGVRSSLPRFHRLTRSFLRSPEQGADTIAWLVAAPDGALESGRFWFDRQPSSASPLPGTADPPQEREGLWAWLEARA
jgi:dehydrogenase/reductase SDR family protein 12